MELSFHTKPKSEITSSRSLKAGGMPENQCRSLSPIKTISPRSQKLIIGRKPRRQVELYLSKRASVKWSSQFPYKICNCPETCC